MSVHMGGEVHTPCMPAHASLAHKGTVPWCQQRTNQPYAAPCHAGDSLVVVGGGHLVKVFLYIIYMSSFGF